MPTPHKHAELIKAWADGAEIQYRHAEHRAWTDVPRPQWDDISEYRIKPVPQHEAIACAPVGTCFRVTGNGPGSATGLADLIVMAATGDSVVVLMKHPLFEVGEIAPSVALRGVRVAVSIAVTEKAP